ncbi:MAG: PBP1A family penicillin-binding protein, partial [Gemmatimonadota bacterium]
MKRETWRKILLGAGGVAVLLFVAATVLYLNCGVRGCPDVNALKGYMPDEASVLLDRDGQEIGKLFVERRFVVGIDSLPEHVPEAFVAMEDRRFWDHGGVDWRRAVGAALTSLRAGGAEEGGSTITMQLARNVFPDKLPASERTVWRKMGEWRVARQIEGEYSKSDILDLYLNQIYFGEGAWGIDAAAREYFGKSATELTLAEAATLAALPRAPSRLNPRQNRELAREERGRVLRRMEEQGLISAAEAEAARAVELELARATRDDENRAPYFVESVRRILEEQLGSALYTEGYRIHTTLDLAAQEAAEDALINQLQAIEAGRFGRYVHATYGGTHAAEGHGSDQGSPYLQGAVVMMDASSGDVLALVGGRDFDDSKFNRATQAMRQPGSAFKPFVYATALAAGLPPTHRLVDRPLTIRIDDGNTWEPKNYGGSYSDVVTLRDALVHSKNVATVRLANEVGMSRVVSTAHQFGLQDVPYYPSAVLGTGEVTPLQMAAAYAAFATLGQRPTPRFIHRVEDRNGRTVWAQQPSSTRVIAPAVAYITVDLMRDVVNRGTGTAVRAAGFRAPAAGKTGTTQEGADAWFVGFTPQVVGAVWIGMDTRARIVPGATGGTLAAPVWGRMMARAGVGGGDWRAPSGIETRTVDARGLVLAANCPGSGEAVREEIFLIGTAPRAECFNEWYAYGDSGRDYEAYMDSLDAAREAEREDGWWDRMRGRLFGGDSARARGDMLQRRLPGDSLRRPDSVRVDTGGGPVGRPLGPPRRPP